MLKKSISYQYKQFETFKSRELFLDGNFMQPVESMFVHE